MPDINGAGGFRCGEYIIYPATRRITRNGEEIEHEAKVFDLILLLIRNRERALEKQEVVTALWGHRPITDAALSQLIYKARRAFEDDGDRQDVIRTIYGRGLQWVAPVEVLPAGRSQPAKPTGSGDTDARSVASPRFDETPAIASARRLRRWFSPAIATVAIVALSAWGLLSHLNSNPPPALPRVALLPIENRTGDVAQNWVEHGLPGLMAGLLDDTRDIKVIDPLQVARAWKFTPAKGQSRDGHAREVVGASEAVSGRLRKLTDRFYELDLHIASDGQRANRDIVLTGDNPAALAIAAVPKLRAELQPETDDHPHPPYVGGLNDSYLAESYARGMAFLTTQDWASAKPYFAVVAKGQPDFLEGRFRLAEAQNRTNQQAEATTTLQAVFAEAKRRDLPALEAKALSELAVQAFDAHHLSQAQSLVDQARPLALRSGDARLQATLELKAAGNLAELGKSSEAREHLRAAQELADRNDLRMLKPRIFNTAVILAGAGDDPAATERAARASLAASQAIGDERGANGETFNIAEAMYQQGRGIEALPLFQRARDWGMAHDDYMVFSGSTFYVARVLYESGADAQAANLNDWLLTQTAQHNDQHVQAYALLTRAGLAWRRGDTTSALQDCAAAATLARTSEDVEGMLDVWLLQTQLTLTADPDSLVSLRRQADALLAKQADPAPYRHRVELLHALSALATGDAAAAQAALQNSVTVSNKRRSADESNFRQVGLSMSLATDNPSFAEFAMRGFDTEHAVQADVLLLYSKWSKKRGDDAAYGRAMARLAGLRTQAVTALGGSQPSSAAAGLAFH